MTSPLACSPAGRVAIVTGGSRGVGRATIHRLATRGYAVVVDYLHDQRAAESTVEQILADNGAAVAVRADVADALDDLIRINTRAAFIVNREAARHLRYGGAIVNLACAAVVGRSLPTYSL